MQTMGIQAMAATGRHRGGRIGLRGAWKLMRRNYMLYLFLLPALVILILLSLLAYLRIQIAIPGISGPRWAYVMHRQWVGLNFITVFCSPRFVQLLRNTIFYQASTGSWPIFATLDHTGAAAKLHAHQRLKRFTQTVTYAPHFISTVVMVGMLSVFLSPRSGFINSLIALLGGEPIFFFGEASWFRHIYVWSGVWQSTGWGSIIYLAALSGVSDELHEAAIIDGAGKLRRIIHIDIPTIMPTMVILLIMNAGRIMNVGFEKAFLMQNNLNSNVSEIISTYTYKMGLIQSEFGYSTAIGLFNNVINFVILLLVNRLARTLSGSSLW